MNRSTRTFAGSAARRGSGSGPPVVATTKRSSPARASMVGRSRRPGSALSNVPWVTWTTGRPAVSSSHQAGRSNRVEGGARIGPTNRTDAGRSRRGYSNPWTVAWR